MAEETQVQENPGVETFITTADNTENARKIELVFNFGRDNNESVEMFGGEVVHGMFTKALKVAIQANVRRMLSATNEDGSLKYSDEYIKNWLENEYKPGVRTARATGEAKLDKLAKELLKLPEDKRVAFLEGIRAKLMGTPAE